MCMRCYLIVEFHMWKYFILFKCVSFVWKTDKPLKEWFSHNFHYEIMLNFDQSTCLCKCLNQGFNWLLAWSETLRDEFWSQHFHNSPHPHVVCLRTHVSSNSWISMHIHLGISHLVIMWHLNLFYLLEKQMSHMKYNYIW